MVIPADFLRLAEARYPAFVFTGESWVLMAEERQVNTVDLYWDESSIGDCALRALTFFGRHAWYWDDTKSGYRFAVEDGYLTSDGRDQIDRLVQHSLPMVDYSL